MGKNKKKIDLNGRIYTPKAIKWDDPSSATNRINQIFDNWSKLTDASASGRNLRVKEVVGLDGFYRKHCVSAIKKYLPHFSEKIRNRCTTIPGKVDPEEIFVELCLHPDGSGYTYSADTIIMGAGLEIYVILKKEGKLDQLEKILDKYEVYVDEFDSVAAIDSILFWRLLEAVEKRNKDCVGSICTEDDMFTNRVTVKEKHKQNVPSRRCFEEIMKLIPREVQDEAIDYLDQEAENYVDNFLDLVEPTMEKFCRYIRNYERQKKEEEEKKDVPIESLMKDFKPGPFNISRNISIPAKKSNISLSMACDTFNELDSIRSAYRVGRLLPDNYFEKFSGVNAEKLKFEDLDTEMIMFAALLIAENVDDRFFCYFPYRDLILSVAETVFYSRFINYTLGDMTNLTKYRLNMDENDEDSEDSEEKPAEEADETDAAAEREMSRKVQYISHVLGSENQWLETVFSSIYKNSLKKFKEELKNAEDEKKIGEIFKEEDHFDYHAPIVGIKVKDGNVIKIPLSSYILRTTGVMLPHGFERDDAVLNSLDIFEIPEEDRKIVSVILDMCQIIKDKEKEREDLLKKLWEKEKEEEPVSEEAVEEIEEEPSSSVTDSPEYMKLMKAYKNLRNSEHALQQRFKKASEEYLEYQRKAELEKEELSQLREIFFKIANGDNKEEPESDIKFPYEVKNKILVMGGFTKWIQNMKTQLVGNIEFVPTGVRVNEDKVRNADYIFFQVNNISHAFYNRAKDIAMDFGVPIRYVSSPGVKFCSQEIAEFDMSVSDQER